MLDVLRTRCSSAIKQARYAARNRRTGTFVVSYPKTGRTWLRVMLGKAMVDAYGHSEQRIPDTYRITAHAPHGPVRFSHGGPLYLFDDRPHHQVEFDAALYRRKRVIHLIRDIRDTLVSFYFQQAKREQRFTGELSAFLRDPCFGAPKLVHYYTMWFRNRGVPAQFLLVRYEELRRRTEEVMVEVLRFLGMAGEVDSLPAAAARAVEYGSFENMRKMEQAQQFDRKMMKPGNPSDAESFKVRRGKVGGYLDYLSPEDLAYMDQVIAELGDPACDWYKA